MQYFKLGGYDYKAQEKIGFGIQLKIAKQQEMLFKKEHPDKSLSDINEKTNETYFSEWTVNNQSSYEVMLSIFSAILKPCPNSPSVEEAFDIAEAEEVTAIGNFFASLGKNNGVEPDKSLTNTTTSDPV